MNLKRWNHKSQAKLQVILKGFSHRKLVFYMLFPLKGYAKKSFTI